MKFSLEILASMISYSWNLLINDNQFADPSVALILCCSGMFVFVSTIEIRALREVGKFPKVSAICIVAGITYLTLLSAKNELIGLLFIGGVVIGISIRFLEGVLIGCIISKKPWLLIFLFLSIVGVTYMISVLEKEKQEVVLFGFIIWQIILSIFAAIKYSEMDARFIKNKIVCVFCFSTILIGVNIFFPWGDTLLNLNTILLPVSVLTGWVIERMS